MDVIFSYTNRNTDVTEKFSVRVDVTGEFPYLVRKLSPYYDRYYNSETLRRASRGKRQHARACVFEYRTAARRSAVDEITGNED